MKHHVNEQSQLSALCYTIRGIKWTAHEEKGGNFPYLSKMDTFIFKKEIEANCLDLDCLRTISSICQAVEASLPRAWPLTSLSFRSAPCHCVRVAATISRSTILGARFCGISLQ